MKLIRCFNCYNRTLRRAKRNALSSYYCKKCYTLVKKGILDGIIGCELWKSVPKPKEEFYTIGMEFIEKLLY